MILTKGKYKGMTLDKVYHLDFNYFIWLNSSDMVTEKDLAEFEYDLEDYSIPFGKYSGQRISNIYKNDKSYFNFLRSKLTDFNNNKLTESIEYYTKLYQRKALDN